MVFNCKEVGRKVQRFAKFAVVCECVEVGRRWVVHATRQLCLSKHGDCKQSGPGGGTCDTLLLAIPQRCGFQREEVQATQTWCNKRCVVKVEAFLEKRTKQLQVCKVKADEA